MTHIIRSAKRAKLLYKYEKLHDEVVSSRVLIEQMIVKLEDSLKTYEIEDSTVPLLEQKINKLEAAKDAIKALAAFRKIYEERVNEFTRTANKLSKL